MRLDPARKSELIASARAVARHAYVPASGFTVGAAVLTPDGGIYTGCNVENASFGLTVCAERNAVGQAVAAGLREIVAVAVWTPLVEPGTPCGACRQVLAEFAPPNGEMVVVLVGTGDEQVELSLTDLLPRPFRFRPESDNRPAQH